MKHFETAEWIDFVNQVVSARTREEMEKHLDTGCKRCKTTVMLWERVRRSGLAEPNYQPPAEAVRIVKAAYAASAGRAGPRKTQGALELLFDSFLQPLVAGARAGGSETRQMLYRAGPYQVDLQIEAKPNSYRLGVTGQLLDSSRPGTAGRDVPVMVSNRRGHAIHLVTNQFGEFSGEIDNSGDFELSITGPGEKAIVICLRDVLGHISGDPR